MATDAVEFILRARDESAATLAKARGGIAGLTGVVGDLAAKAGLLGALTAGVTSLAGGVLAAGKQFADMVEGLDRLQAATGVPIEKLQVLHEVFKRAGLAAEDADRALTFMARAIGRGDPILAKLGITTRDVYEAMLQLGDAFGRGSDHAAKQELALKILGKSSSEAIGTLDSLRVSVDHVGSQMRQLGGILDPETTKKARALDQQLDDLGTAWQAMTTSALSATVPWATKTLTVFEAVARAVLALSQQFALFFQILAGKVSLLDSVVRQDTLDRLQTFVREITKAIAASTGTIEGPTGAGPTPTSEGDAILRRAAAEGGGGASKAKKKSSIPWPVEELLDRAGKLAEATGRWTTEDQALNSALETTNAQMLEQVAGLALVQQGMTESQRATLESSVAFLEWQEAAAAATSSVAVMNDGLRALWSGLESGFMQVAANLTNRAQTLRSAMKTIFSSLVQEVLAMLARLAAAKIFQLILNLIAPGAGTAGAIVFGAATGGAAGGGAARLSAGAPRGDVQLNIAVSALDEGSVLKSLTSPNGALRVAFADAALRRPR